MSHRTTLFVMDAKTPDAVVTEAAETAARQQGHLSCLLLGMAPALPIYAYGAPPYGGLNIPDNWNELVEDAYQSLKTRADEVEALLARSDASGGVQPVVCATVDIQRHVARAARAADEVVLATNLRDAPDILREAAYGVLYHSCVGLLLNGPAPNNAARVFVAWDSSEAATRALHAALPYLKDAEEVTIGCIDPVLTPHGDGEDPGTDIASWLSRHGCNVTVSQYPGGGLEVAQCIQDRAREVGADLIVMGAYGSSRRLEAIFGGTTRTMIDQTEQAVFLAH